MICKIDIHGRTFKIFFEPVTKRYIVSDRVNPTYDKELHSHATLGEALHALSMAVLGVERERRIYGDKESY